MQFLLVPAGAVLGVLVGFVTRPSYFGIQPPLGILSSTHPSDALAKNELANHLGNYGTIGAVAGCILVIAAHVAMTYGRKSR